MPARGCVRTSPTSRWPCCGRPGLPARYVSGYLYPGKESAVLDEPVRPRATPGSSSGPATGSPPTRPTCPRSPTGTCIVARGRDYADVRPLTGIYSGPAPGALGVTVELTRLR